MTKLLANTGIWTYVKNRYYWTDLIYYFDRNEK